MGDHRKLVVGGGIAGSAAALFLRRIGVEPVILESVPESRAPAGPFLNVAPNGLAVLDELGIGDEVRAAGAPVERMAVASSSGGVLGSATLGDAFHRFQSVRRDRVGRIFDWSRRNGGGKTPSIPFGRRLLGRAMPVARKVFADPAAHSRDYEFEVDWEAPERGRSRARISDGDRPSTP